MVARAAGYDGSMGVDRSMDGWMAGTWNESADGYVQRIRGFGGAEGCEGSGSLCARATRLTARSSQQADVALAQEKKEHRFRAWLPVWVCGRVGVGVGVGVQPPGKNKLHGRDSAGAIAFQSIREQNSRVSIGVLCEWRGAHRESRASPSLRKSMGVEVVHFFFSLVQSAC